MYVTTGAWDGGYQAHGQPNYLTWETTWVNSYSYSYPSEPAYYSYTVQVPYTYYQDVTETQSFNGQIIGQTLVAPRAGWLVQLGLYYTQIGPAGDVRVLVVKTNGGKPDMSKVVSQALLSRSAMKKYPERTPLAIPPVMVSAGERLAIVEITQGNHYAAMGQAGYTEGTFFTGTDGEFFQGDITKDRKVEMFFANFAAPRTEVALQNVSLAGGISELIITTEQPSLPGSTLHYEMQIAGLWERIALDNLGKLASTPDIIPLRAVFTGTADIQCGLQLGTNRIKASRPGTVSQITSNAITVSAKRYFQVDILVDSWHATKNTATCQLLTGSGYATVTNPTTSVVLDGDQGGFKKLRFTFDVGSTVNTYKVRHTLNRSSDGPVPIRVDRTAVATG